MKNFHKNKNKRVNDRTPTPKSHNVLIGSRESSPTAKHIYIENNSKIVYKNKRQTRRRKTKTKTKVYTTQK